METPDDGQLLEFLYACPVGLIECDARGDISIINPHAMQHLLPIAGERDPTNLFSALEAHAPELQQIVASAARPIGRICEGHRIFVDLADGHRSLETKVLACTIVRLGPNRLMVTLADVSTEVAREQRLSQSEAANLAKSQFLANMNHELRTPLNGVLGMAQALALESLSPNQRAKVQTIRDAGEALLGLLDDIFDLSKIETGELELEIAPFDLEQMAVTTCAIFAEKAKVKGLPIFCTIQGGARGFWEGDVNRCRQILSNLLSNAVKFTAAGEVRVSLELTEFGDARIRVSDTGMGIDAVELPKLFSKFYQIDGSTTRRFGGSGLGLSICQSLSQMMGGAVTIESELGRGSTFSVELPLKFLGAAAPEAGVLEVRDRSYERGEADVALLASAAGSLDSSEALTTLRVLAAEDNPTNQLILKTLLENFDVKMVVVDNGRLAVEAWESEAFDLILMDIQMPELDGVNATRQIRTLEKKLDRTRTPIIALTANFMPHQIQEYEHAGMDGLVKKPIQLEQLLQAIEKATTDCQDSAFDAVECADGN